MTDHAPPAPQPGGKVQTVAPGHGTNGASGPRQSRASISRPFNLEQVCAQRLVRRLPALVCSQWGFSLLLFPFPKTAETHAAGSAKGCFGV